MLVCMKMKFVYNEILFQKHYIYKAMLDAGEKQYHITLLNIHLRWNLLGAEEDEPKSTNVICKF